MIHFTNPSPIAFHSIHSILDAAHIHQPSALISLNMAFWNPFWNDLSSFDLLHRLPKCAPSLLHKRKTPELAAKWPPHQEPLGVVLGIDSDLSYSMKVQEE